MKLRSLWRPAVTPDPHGPMERARNEAEAMERSLIEAGQAPCTTAPDMTGARCRCAVDCRNYWLRAKGLA